ncbi:MAG: Flp pilus assembly protein CpaB, partial [Acidobacteriales bacterium]|nr:Flp pilus assembly protein CpaB [Terriglobales bacterium]
MPIRRMLMAFLMAAVLATAITYFFSRHFQGASGASKKVRVVASTTDLPVGVTLSAKDVTEMDWPSDVPLAGSITKVEEVIGRPLLYSLGPKQPILTRDVGVQGSGIGLSGKIPDGMRATAVRSNEIVGVAGFLYPGSHVDVLATYNASNGQSAMTETVLQNV